MLQHQHVAGSLTLSLLFLIDFSMLLAACLSYTQLVLSIPYSLIALLHHLLDSSRENLVTPTAHLLTLYMESCELRHLLAAHKALKLPLRTDQPALASKKAVLS